MGPGTGTSGVWPSFDAPNVKPKLMLLIEVCPNCPLSEKDAIVGSNPVKFMMPVPTIEKPGCNKPGT